DRPVIGALEVGHVDDVHGRKLRHELVVPLAPRVELEARAGIALEEPPELVERLDAPRDDERDRPRLAPDRLGERTPRLPQREVERRALEPPAPAVVA